jgi:glycosyltransferase involved in cell wall biosynthesis
MELPRITIVTPSYNSVRFIRETVSSVLDQQYPDLEYLVFDGGSTDGTVELLRQHEGQLRWVSEQDDGQSDAINKGFRIASGEILSWINSNDIYLPGCFEIVGRYFLEHPNVDMVFGRALLIAETGEHIGEYGEQGEPEEMLELNKLEHGHFDMLLNGNAGWIPQQTVFWRTSLTREVGLLNPDLHYAMDYEYWLRLGRRGTIHFINSRLGGFRLHEDAKSGNARKHWREVLAINRRYHGKFFSKVHRRFLQVAWEAVKRRVLPGPGASQYGRSA